MKALPLGCVVLLTAVITEILLFPYKVWLKSSYESELHQIATNLNSYVLNELSEPIYISIGISSYIQSHNGQVTDDVLSSWLESLFNYTSHTRNIGVAPDNILRFIYPLAGNEGALGLDYRDIPEQWAEIERFMTTGKSQFFGPITLVQGGQAFAYRHPIFVDNKYWGLVSTIIEAESVITNIKQEAQLYDANVRILNATGTVIYAKDDALSRDSRYRVMQQIPLPNTYWTLQATSMGSPAHLYAARGGLWLFWLFTFTASYWLYLNAKTRRTEKRHAQEMKAQFLASVSHELKTPLTVLQGSLALLKQPGLSADKQHALINAASSHQHRLNRLIMDILDYNLAINQQLPIALQQVNLTALLYSIFDEYAPIFQNSHIAFSINSQKERQQDLVTDPERLAQVLRHILDNSAKFCAAGDSVHLSLVIDENITISVSDSGPGIPAQFAAVHAEPLHQSDGSDARQQGGTGLGLALCREIMRALGAEFRIHGNMPQGSIVSLVWTKKSSLAAGQGSRTKRKA